VVRHDEIVKLALLDFVMGRPGFTLILQLSWAPPRLHTHVTAVMGRPGFTLILQLLQCFGHIQ